MGKMFRGEQERGDAPGPASDKQSFHDAWADNPSAQEPMKDEVLATMAKELVEMPRRDAAIDRQFKETVLQQAEPLGEHPMAPLTQ